MLANANCPLTVNRYLISYN